MRSPRSKVFSDAILKSNVNTLVIRNAVELPIKGTDATSLDFSNQDFGPDELVLISSLVIPFTAAVNSVSEVNKVANRSKAFGPIPMSLISSFDGSTVRRSLHRVSN